MAGRPNIGTFCPKFFSAKKICIFWPETKNRPEISISGWNLAIWTILAFWGFFQKFWLWKWPEGRKFRRFLRNFFRLKKYIFSARKLKIGQKFLFPAEIWLFEKFIILAFWGFFSKILTLEVAGGPKIRAFCPKFFSANKICIFWPETKKSARNFYFRPKFGHLKKIQIWHFGDFFNNFNFGSSRRAEISGVLSEFFSAEEIYIFLAENQKSARNFYFRPKFGHLKKI